MATTKYPEITVKLLGNDGNAFYIIGKVKQALKRADISKEEQDKFLSEAMGGDYNHLLRTCMEWVTVD